MLRLSLRNKLLTAFSMLVLPLVVLLLLEIHSNWNRREKDLIDDQLQTVQTLGMQLDALFDSAISEGWAVANDPWVKTLHAKVLDIHLKQLVLSNSLFAAVNVFDSDGNNRGWGSAVSPAQPRSNIADQSQFRKAMQTNLPAISSVRQLRSFASPGIAVAVPIRDSRGAPIGVVSVVILSSRLTESFGQIALHEGQAISLIDTEGKLALDSRLKNLTVKESELFKNLPELQSALAGTSVVLKRVLSPIDHQEKIGVLVSTPKYHWVVGSSISRKIVFRELRDALRGQIAAVFGMLLLSAVLAIYLARRLAAPVLKLKSHAVLLGQGTVDQPVTIQTGDEFELLADSFNEMSRQIQSREHALKKSEAQYRRLVETAEEGIWTIDENQITTFVNPKMAQMLGYAQEEILGKGGMAFASPTEIPMHDRQIELRKQGLHTQYDLKFIRKDGTPLWTILSASPIYDEQGKYAGSLGVITDITERKKNEQDLARLAEENARLYAEAKRTLDLREEFLSIASHELKTPLTPLKIQLQLLKRLSDQDLLATFPKDKLAFIVSSGEHELGRLVRLVEDLLDVSRIQSGQLQLNLKTVDLSSLLAELAERFRPQFATANCILSVTLQSDLNVTADAFRLEQIITNLFTNAIKYGAGKPVSIDLRLEKNQVVFELRDEGIGIAEKDHARIFSRFERAVSGRNFGGLGLGLYITQQLVTAHHGKIQVKSQLGAGALFRIDLPAA
ncbi:MAG: PAS domain S-box protein [Methylotenera sp.]|nr:PAS domain S-box protein [Oligoflexia bacterium]